MLDRGQRSADDHLTGAPVDLDGGRPHRDTQEPYAAVDLPRGHTRLDAHTKLATDDLAGGRSQADAQPPNAASSNNRRPSGSDAQQTDAANGGAHRRVDAHFASGAADNFAVHGSCGDHGVPDRDGEGRSSFDAHSGSALADSLLLVYADAVEDLQRTRIATANRLGALARDKGLAESPESKRMAALMASLDAAERHATRELERAMRAHPLGPWVEATQGIGLKSAARLLAAIGDPADRTNPSKLWAYCGLHVINGKRPRRTRGQQANWNTKAKTRAYLCAESCMKNRRSPYRAVYDREREKWAERDTTDLHKHNHALSVTAKAILLDLWREATRLARGQCVRDDHLSGAAREPEVAHV